MQFQVKKLVSEEMFAKYDKLLLQTSLDMMLDVTYCPRPTCRSPVLMDKDSAMASCPECRFTFCTLCKLTYHGLSPCRMKSGRFLSVGGLDKGRSSLVFFLQYLSYNSTKPYVLSTQNNHLTETVLSSTLNIGFS